MTTLPTNVQVLLFDYGDKFRDNGLLGPRSAVSLSKEPSDEEGNPELGPGIKMPEQEWE